MNKLQSIIKGILGTKNNIKFKLNLSFFVTAVFFYILTIMFNNNEFLKTAYSIVAGTMFAFWLSFSKDANSALEYILEIARLIFFLFTLLIAIYIPMIILPILHGIKFWGTLSLSCILFLCCSFYFISKFIDIFTTIKNIFIQTKDRLFNSIQSETTKTKALIENITAFFVSIAGLGLALKTIAEPLINLFKQFFI